LNVEATTLKPMPPLTITGFTHLYTYDSDSIPCLWIPSQLWCLT